MRWPRERKLEYVENVKDRFSMNLEERYQKEIKQQLKKELKLSCVMAVPEVKKIVVSVGMAEARENKKLWEEIGDQLALVTGQKPVRTRAKKAISGFKLRIGDEIGLMVTLRGKRMYDFLDKLINVSLARVRDFRGVSDKSFDGSGNYNLGFSEQLVFPEINPARVTKVKGVQVTIVMNTRSDKEARALLKKLGMPFNKEN